MAALLGAHHINLITTAA